MTPSPSDPVGTPDLADDALNHVARAGADPVDWWARPVTRWVALLAATALVLYLCWLMLAPFVDVLMWAVVLVVVFYPLHRRILARTGSPNWSAAISCLLVVFTILIPLALVTLMVVRDAARFAHHLQDARAQWLDPDAAGPVGRALDWADRYVDVDRFRSQQWLSQRIASMSGAIASRTLNVVGGILGVVVQIFFVIFTMFYLFRDGPKLRESVRDVLPLDRWQSHEVFLRTKEVITASVRGSLVIAAIQGTLGGLAFWALGLPGALLWGVVMILLCMIPMAGAFIVWVPAALYLAVTGHWVKAIILTAFGTLVIGTIDNVLRPRLVGSRTRLHELVVFFAVLGGIDVFGILGIVTGPVVAAVAIALFHVWRQARTTTPIATAAIVATPEV